MGIWAVVEAIMTPIDAGLELALIALASAHIPPQPLALTLRNVRWCGLPCATISELAVTATGELLLDATPPGEECLLDNPEDWQANMFIADIPEHGVLEIQAGFSRMKHLHYGAAGPKLTARLEAFAWHALPDVAVPTTTKLWAAHVDLAPTALQLSWLRRGNLAIRTGTDTVWAWVLRTCVGMAFLIPTEDRNQWILAFELATESGVPDCDRIPECLIALSFALGIPLHVSLLYAVGDAGIQAGLVCPGFVDLRPAKRSTQSCAIPGEEMRAWLPRFIELAITEMCTSGSPLLVALHLHAESVDGFVDTQFLRSWIAAEALANWGLRNQRFSDPGEFRVADPTAWNEWVKQHESEIRGLALAGKEDNLLKSVASSMGSRGSPMQRMFAGAGLPWLTEMDEAERVRNMVAHEGTTHGKAQRDWKKDVALVEFARTILTSVIAKLIGYDGPIVDRVEDRRSETKRPTWWTSAESPAAVIYECKS
jgi:hypothetical protein